MREPKKSGRKWGPNFLWNLPDREWLEREYITLGKTIEKIAEEVGASKATVHEWLYIKDVPCRKCHIAVHGGWWGHRGLKGRY